MVKVNTLPPRRDSSLRSLRPVRYQSHVNAVVEKHEELYMKAERIARKPAFCDALDSPIVTPRVRRRVLAEKRLQPPSALERKVVSQKHDLPRRLFAGSYRVNTAPGIDIKLKRKMMLTATRDAWNILKYGAWERVREKHARLVFVACDEVDLSVPMPTHVLQVYSAPLDEPLDPKVPLPAEPRENDRCLVVPVHEPVLNSFCANIPPLAKAVPLTIWTPKTQDGKELDYDHEVAAGVVPFHSWRIPNVDTFPALLSHLYLRKPDLFYQLLIGAMNPTLEKACPVGENVPEFDAEVLRWAEYEQAKDLAHTTTEDMLLNNIKYTNALAENGNHFGIDDETFWWCVSSAWRILTDALVIQERDPKASLNAKRANRSA